MTRNHGNLQHNLIKYNRLRYYFGAGKRNRTPDLLITNELLYRLSYSGLSRIITFDCRYLLNRLSVVVGDARYFIFAPQDHAHALV